MINLGGHLIPLIDFHTHIGRVDIETTKGKSQRINNPRDILDLYEKLQYELYKRFNANPADYYIELPELASQLAVPMHPLAQMILDLKHPTKTQGWLVDQVVTFPFNDVFHLDTKPKFVRSNEFVRKRVQTLDFIFRFIPFCRVDATDGDEACKEIEKSVEFGSRGLKLHPMSQGWIDRISTKETESVLLTAGKLGIPIIFDIPNKNVSQDVTDVARTAREKISRNQKINVVLGHAGFDYSSSTVFDNLAENQMYCETSGMRGRDVELFFKNVMTVDDWFMKVLYGSDHNYFNVLQAADFITFLFSQQFIELLEENDQKIDPYKAASMILGGNALRLIPKTWHSKQAKKSDVTFFCNRKDFPGLIGDFIKLPAIIAVDRANINQVADEFTDILVISQKRSYLAFKPEKTGPMNRERYLLTSVELKSADEENNSLIKEIPLLNNLENAEAMSTARKLSTEEISALMKENNYSVNN